MMRELAVESIGLDPRPGRRIRPLDEAYITYLMEETLPVAWDPITVRPWPASDPYPPGEEGRPYQAVDGHHRVTAARRLRLKKLRAWDPLPLSDQDFLLDALARNRHHGQRMSHEETVDVLRRLHEVERMTLDTLAKRTHIPLATISNWLSGRDTNAARKVRSRDAKVPAERQDTVAPGEPASAVEEPPPEPRTITVPYAGPELRPVPLPPEALPSVGASAATAGDEVATLD